MKKWFFTYWLTLMVLIVRGQLKFEHLSLEQGLSQSSVGAILQDKDGFLWVSTGDGLNRYDGYSFKVYQHHNQDPKSLSSNQVRSLVEDRQGNLWVGTFGGGLNLFDRKTETFKAYRHNEQDSNSLSHDVINKVFEDHEGIIWIGTRLGLDKFDPKNGRFIRYQNDQKNPKSLGGVHVWEIYEDRSHTLWVATQDGGLSQFEPKTNTFINYFPDPLSNGLSDKPKKILEDRQGNLWLGTRNGLDLFNRKTKEFIHYKNDPKNPKSLPDNYIYTLFEDNQRTLWIGTDNGLAYFNRATNDFTVIKKNPTQSDGLNDDTVFDIYQDRTGILWFGTNSGGLNKLNNLAEKFQAQLSVDNVTAIIETTNTANKAIQKNAYDVSPLWLGTENEGLLKIDQLTGKSTKFLKVADKNSLSNNTVYCLAEYPKGILWIGTDGGGVDRLDTKTGIFTNFQNQENNAQSLVSKFVRCLGVSPSGVIWIGTEGGLSRYSSAQGFTNYKHNPNNPNSLSVNQVISIWVDSDEIIWIGTREGGLNQLNTITGKFKLYKHTSSNIHSLSNNSIELIKRDSAGRLWVGTNEGLNLFDEKTETFTAFTVQNGLPNDLIRGILEEKPNEFWVSTNKGLSRIKLLGQPTFENFNVLDGLQSNEFNNNSAWKSATGQMFFGGIKGYNSFFPEKLKKNKTIPPIGITDFQILNKSVPISESKAESHWWKSSANQENLPNEIVLDYQQNVFSFEFAALDFTLPEKNQYAYQLVGFHKNWVYSGNRRFVTYTNLPAGDYVFRVKGSNNDGVWNEKGIAIKIIITPPFWQTWWFRSLVFLGLAGVVFGFFRWRVQQIRAEEERKAVISQQIADLRMRALRTQMNPHFLFNSLNAIQECIITGQTDAAVSYLAKFSRLVRMILENSDKRTIPLSKELDLLKVYLEIESLRFTESFRYELKVKTHIDPTLINVLPMMVQPYIENAIWHGLMNKEGERLLTVGFKSDEDFLYITIEDNGIGRAKASTFGRPEKEKHASMGMRITDERLNTWNELNKNNPQLTASAVIEDLVDAEGGAAGTKVKLTLPLV